MNIKKNLEKNTYIIELTKGTCEVVTILGKAGAGLGSYSKELLATNLNADSKIKYISDSTAKYLIPKEGLEEGKLSNLNVFYKSSPTEDMVVDYVSLINDDTTDFLFINCFSLLTDDEKDYFFRTSHSYVIVVFHQAPFSFKGDLDTFKFKHEELVEYSDLVAYVERNEDRKAEQNKEHEVTILKS